MSIVLSGGGTGGHLAIVRSVKEALKSRGDSTLVFIGSTRGQDRQWFGEDSDFEVRYFLDSKGVVNKRGVAKAASLWQLTKSIKQAAILLKKHEAKVLFSVGGYSAAPAAFAALLLRIPIVIHEQNAHIGSLNRLLRPFSKAFLSSYEKNSPIRSYPVASRFFNLARTRSAIETVIFLGGSQGAKAINAYALKVAPKLHKRGIKIIHQAGVRFENEVKIAYEALGTPAVVFGFSKALDRYLQEADFAVARAGASTLWELTAMGLPALFVPYPYAAADHQYHNAKFLSDKGLAWVKREADLSSDDLLQKLELDLESISIKLQEQITPGGSDEIAALLTQLAHK